MKSKYSDEYFNLHMKGGYEQQRTNPTFQKRINEFKALGYDKGRVLDIGCAYGYFLEHCEKAGYEVLGSDIAELAIEKAKQNGFPDVFLHDISNNVLPLDNDSIDIIAMFNTLEHIENYPHALRECLRVLRSGGLLYIYVPTLSRWLTDETHLNYFTMETLRFVLRNEGFEIIKMGEEGGKLRNIFGVIRLLLKGNTNFNFIPRGTGAFISCFAKKT